MQAFDGQMFLFFHHLKNFAKHLERLVFSSPQRVSTKERNDRFAKILNRSNDSNDTKPRYDCPFDY